MCEALPNYVVSLVDQIIDENGFNEYSVRVNPGSQPGDNFSSDVYSIKIAELFSEKQLKIVIKMAPNDEVRRVGFMAKPAFNREAIFYKQIMPTFAAFQQEKYLAKNDEFISCPKCYKTMTDDDHEHYVIIMEDLRPQGFRLWDKTKPVPIENMRLVMRELGKFHGLSIAMKDQKPKEFAEFKQIGDIVRTFFHAQKDTFSGFYDRAIKSLESEDHKNIMRDIKNNSSSYFEYCVNNETSDHFRVLSHGDCWNNNILYRFNDNDIAEDIRFLDWPNIRYVSPALDLLYNIFSSTDKTLRDSEYENLLRLYHKSLCRTVKLLGSNPNELFTFEDLNEEMKRYGYYALLMVPMILQISMAKMDQNGVQDFNAQLSKEVQQVYDQRMNDFVRDIVKLDYYKKIHWNPVK